MRFPVFKVLSDTFAFIGRNALDILRIVWAPALLMGVIGALVMPRYIASMSAFLDSAPGATPEQVMQAAQGLLPDMLLLLAFDLIAYPVMFAGLLKLVLRDERPPRFAYLGFGLEELRIIGTWALSFVILFSLILLSQLVTGASAALSQIGGGGGQAVGIVLEGVVLAALIWVGVKLSLATAASVDLDRIGVNPAWTASKGATFSLLAFWAVFALAALLLQTLLFNLLSPEQVAIIAEAEGATTQEARAEIAARANAAAIAAYDLTQPANLARFIVMQVLGAAMLTIVAIASGFAWRRLRPESR